MDRYDPPDTDSIEPPVNESPSVRARAYTILPPRPDTASSSLGVYRKLLAAQMHPAPPLQRTPIATTVQAWCKPAKARPQTRKLSANTEKLRTSLSNKYQALAEKLRVAMANELHWPQWAEIEAVLTDETLDLVLEHFKNPLIIPIPPVSAPNLATIINRNAEHYNNAVLERVYFKAERIANQKLYQDLTDHEHVACWHVLIVEDPGSDNADIAEASGTVHECIAALVSKYHEQQLSVLSGAKQYLMLSLTRLLMYERLINDDDKDSWTVLNPYISAVDSKEPVGLGQVRDHEIVFSYANPAVTHQALQVHPALYLPLQP